MKKKIQISNSTVDNNCSEPKCFYVVIFFIKLKFNTNQYTFRAYNVLSATYWKQLHN